MNQSFDQTLIQSSKFWSNFDCTNQSLIETLIDRIKTLIKLWLYQSNFDPNFDETLTISIKVWSKLWLNFDCKFDFFHFAFVDVKFEKKSWNLKAFGFPFSRKSIAVQEEDFSGRHLTMWLDMYVNVFFVCHLYCNCFFIFLYSTIALLSRMALVSLWEELVHDSMNDVYRWLAKSLT